MVGLAFSQRIRCIVLLTLPQFFSEKGRQALLAYAFILTISGPAKNTLNNMGIMSESLACGQEQLKAAVRQIIDVIKKPFYAIKDAIKKVVKTVKEIIKKIKEILLKIKRIIMAIIRVIKAAFQFLARIINICNKELGTPFERCSRVFENAILDCNAKLGPMFNWLCSITYIVKSVCYLVKPFDLVCMIIDFISNSIIGVVIRKVKSFVRHIRTMFYVRIRFSHSFQFQTNSSKSVAEISEGIITEIKGRTQVLQDIFHFLTSAASLFFMFIIFKVIYYRYKFLTSEKFDNKYITKDFHKIDMRRAKLDKETVLPLNNREVQIYIKIRSGKLVKSEKKALSKAISTLATATLKIAIHMACDYSLYWVLNLIKYYGRFQSKVQAPNLPSAHISGKGLLADLLRSIVKAFQPSGLILEIDTVPCLPTPIPPDYDRYVQIATLLLLCWILTVLEPYGLRLRHTIMSYYHPQRARQRSIWLYNHIMRSRNSFLKFARRQLRRKLFGTKGIEKITFKEFLAANSRILALCLDKPQVACLLCGEVFRETDDKKPIKCQTPGCIGVYCERCFADLQNLCTVCLSPIEYGDLSDIDEEKDSSEEEPRQITRKKEKIDKRRTKKDKCSIKWWSSKEKEKQKPLKVVDQTSLDDDREEAQEKEIRKIGEKDKKRNKWWLFRDKEKQKPQKETPHYDSENDYEVVQLLKEDDILLPAEDGYKESIKIPADSDYYSSDNSTDYSYSYQDVKKVEENATLPVIHFKDVEKQEIPDYASMDSFRENLEETVDKRSAETAISGTTFKINAQDKRVDFVGIPEVIKKKKKLKKKKKKLDEMSLMDPYLCFCSDSNEDDVVPIANLLYSESSLITLPKSTMSTTTKHMESDVADSLKHKFSHVLYDDIDESPRSTLTSRNLSSSSYVSSSPEKDVAYTKHNLPRRNKNTSRAVTSLIQMESTTSDEKKLEVKQRNKVKEYYKAVKSIPTGSVERSKKTNKLKTLIQKIIPKRKENLGELPLYTSDAVELNSYSLPQKSIVTPKCKCTPKYHTLKPENFSSSEENQKKRIRGGGSIAEETSYRSLVKEKDRLLDYFQSGDYFHSSESVETNQLLARYSLDIEDLTPTKDSGFQMTKEEPIELTVFDTTLTKAQTVKNRESGSGSIGSIHSSAGSQTSNNKRVQPEKDPRSSVGVSLQPGKLRPKRENSSSTDSQVSVDNPLKSSSSNLSEGFCMNILGKPCQTRGNYQNFYISTQQEDPENSDVLLPVHDQSFESRQISVQSESLPRIEVVQQEVPKNTATQQKLGIGTNSSIPEKKKNSDVLLPVHNQSFESRQISVQSERLLPIKVVPQQVPKNTATQQKLGIGTNSSISEKNQYPQQDNQDRNEISNNTNTFQRNQHIGKDNTRSSLESTNQIERNLTNRNKSISDQQLQSVTSNSRQSRTSNQTSISSQNQAQQTNYPPILKQFSPIHESLISVIDPIPSVDRQSQTGNNNRSGTSIRSSSEMEPKERDITKDTPERDINYRVPTERQKIILTSDKILQTSENNLFRSTACVRCCGTEETQSFNDASVNTLMGDSIKTQIATSDDRFISDTLHDSSSAYQRSHQLCCKCSPSPPPPLQSEDYSSSRNIQRYPSEKSIRSSRNNSPRVYPDYLKERTYSPCGCRYEEYMKYASEVPRKETGRPVQAKPHKEMPRQRAHREELMCTCAEDCRCCSKKKPYPPPMPPPYKYRSFQYNSSSSEEESDEGDNNSYYSDGSPVRYNLPYQNQAEYLDLVQELEDTLQSRSRNRVKRAMHEFERRSRYNKPLEKPIINYDETSESEEPLIQKISQLTEKRICCVTGNECTCKKQQEKHYRKTPKPKPVERPKSVSGRRQKRTCEKTHWQMDSKSGEWYKVPQTLPRRRRSRTPSPQKKYCSYDCNCCSKDYR